MKNLTTERLAAILSEELEADDWGDIDPFIFKLIAAREGGQYVPDMREVLDRVVRRLKEE